MRLNRLKTLLKPLPIENMALRRGNSDPNGTAFSNIEQFKNLLTAISGQPFFKQEVDFLLNSALYTTTANDLYITKKNNPEEINTVASNLIAQLYGIRLMLDKIVADESPEIISIRLPDPADFSGLVADLQTFKQAIEQVIINPSINGILKVTKWETGSFWIDLYLGTTEAVTLVAGVTWSALVLCKKFAEFTILWETAKSLKIKNESLSDLRNQQEALTANLVDSEARYLEEQSFDGAHDNERLERIKKSIKVFATLIQRGAEVQPSLMAPEAVQNLFPDFSKPTLIESKIPLLRDITEGNTAGQSEV